MFVNPLFQDAHCVSVGLPFSLWLLGNLGPNLRQNYNNSMGLECLTLWLGFSRHIYVVPTPVVCSCYVICIVCSFCNPGMGRERNKLIIKGMVYGILSRDGIHV